MSLENPFAKPQGLQIGGQTKRGKIPPPFEAEQRQRIIQLWRKRQIDWNQNTNGGRIRPEPRDIEEYRARKRKHEGTGMYSTEESAYAEYMLLELMDSDGVTGQKLSLFGESAHAYEPSDLDDAMIGPDAVVLYVDPEDERRAAPIVIDAATNPERLQEKQLYDALKVTRGPKEMRLARAYWYDTKAEEAGLNFDDPKEGKISVINTSVYVPPEYAKRFTDPKVTAEEARRDMDRLGSFVLKQQQLELEWLAIAAAKRISPDDIRRGRLSILGIETREDLLDALETAKKDASPDGLQAMQTFGIALQNVWETQDAREGKGKICDPRDLKALGQAVLAPEFLGLRAEDAEAAE